MSTIFSRRAEVESKKKSQAIPKKEEKVKHKDRPSWFIRNNSTFCTFGAGTERNCHNAQKFSSLRIERNSHNYHKFLISIVLRTGKIIIILLWGGLHRIMGNYGNFCSKMDNYG